MTDIEIPEYVEKWARGRGRGSDISDWVLSMLPPPPPPTLRDKARDLINQFRINDSNTERLLSDLFMLIAQDLADNYGWEAPHVNEYLKGQ